VEQTAIKEAVTRELFFVLILAQIEEETVENQVGNLLESIQKLQERVEKLELQVVSSTPQKV
jgi:hypothetical protein